VAAGTSTGPRGLRAGCATGDSLLFASEQEEPAQFTLATTASDIALVTQREESLKLAGPFDFVTKGFKAIGHGLEEAGEAVGKGIKKAAEDVEYSAEIAGKVRGSAWRSSGESGISQVFEVVDIFTLMDAIADSILSNIHESESIRTLRPSPLG